MSALGFFWRERPCGACGRADVLHIGLFKPGMRFLFRAHPVDGIKDFSNWCRRFYEAPGEIVDHTGEVWTADRFLTVVRRGSAGRRQWTATPNAIYIDSHGFAFSRVEIR